MGVIAALALLGALAGFLGGLALFSVSYGAWILAVPLSGVGAVLCVWIIARIEQAPAPSRKRNPS